MRDNSFFWGIASYNRPDRQHMLNYLSGMGYAKEDIVISTQNEKDFNEYSKRYSDRAIVIYREGRNVCDNKNNILNYARERRGNSRLVMCSDKVRGIRFLSNVKKCELRLIENRALMDAFIEKAFAITKELRAEVFGCYTVANNAFFMKHTISTNLQILGCFMGIADPSLQYFDPEQPLKEDFEFILRHIQNRRTTVRFNDISLKATFHTKGGSYELWQDEELCRKCNERILNKYAGLVRLHPTRKNEQKYIGPTTTYKASILSGLV